MFIVETSPEDSDDDYVEHLLVSKLGRFVRNRSSLIHDKEFIVEA